MSNILSVTTLAGLGAVILIVGLITLGLRVVGLPREVALYLAVCVVAGSVVLLYGRFQRRR